MCLLFRSYDDGAGWMCYRMGVIRDGCDGCVIRDGCDGCDGCGCVREV